MITITLPPELEQAVTERAQNQGTTPELLVLDRLREQFLPALPPEELPEGATMADFLADFIGCIDSGEIVPGGAQMSKDIGKKFTQDMVEKRKAGRL